MEFRKIRIGDAKAGRAFINALVDEGADIGVRKRLSLAQERAWIRELLLDSGRIHLCAFDRGLIVGSVEVRLGRDEISRHVGEFGISVKKEYRGTGLAHSLAKKIFAIVKKRSLSIIYLKVFSTNARALTFYRKLGFRKLTTLRRGIKVGRKYIDAYFMEKSL